MRGLNLKNQNAHPTSTTAPADDQHAYSLRLALLTSSLGLLVDMDGVDDGRGKTFLERNYLDACNAYHQSIYVQLQRGTIVAEDVGVAELC